MKRLKLTIDNRFTNKIKYEKFIGRTFFDRENYIRKVKIFDINSHQWIKEKVELKKIKREKNIIFVVII